MYLRHRRFAWFMLCTLVVILGLICFASAHEHRCPNEGACPICLYLNSGSKLSALMLSSLFSVSVVFHFQWDVPNFVLPSVSLITQKIQMNN